MEVLDGIPGGRVRRRRPGGHLMVHSSAGLGIAAWCRRRRHNVAVGALGSFGRCSHRRSAVAVGLEGIVGTAGRWVCGKIEVGFGRRMEVVGSFAVAVDCSLEVLAIRTGRIVVADRCMELVAGSSPGSSLGCSRSRLLTRDLAVDIWS